MGFVLRRLEPHAATIVRAYGLGASFKELADCFGCSPGTIRRFLLTQDVALRPVPRKRKLDRHRDEVMAAIRAGTDVVSIALRFRVQPETVRSFVMRSVMAD